LLLQGAEVKLVIEKNAKDPGFRFAGSESIPLAVTVSVGAAREETAR
jgi:hypothetical protein